MEEIRWGFCPPQKPPKNPQDFCQKLIWLIVLLTPIIDDVVMSDAFLGNRNLVFVQIVCY